MDPDRLTIDQEGRDPGFAFGSQPEDGSGPVGWDPQGESRDEALGDTAYGE